MEKKSGPNTFLWKFKIKAQLYSKYFKYVTIEFFYILFSVSILFLSYVLGAGG